MKKVLPILYNGTHCYNIQLESSFDGLASSIRELKMTGKRLCIVSDSNVDGLYGAEVQNVLENAGFSSVHRFVFPAGEEHKTLDVITDLYEFLIQKHFDCSDVLIALGGGVTGDMTGYVAATYLRGIRFIQVPTSLLSMVDSSIGGKTGVDFRGYKNMVGAFYMPSLVYVNLSVLHSLDERQRASGMGEIIKHSLIRDKNYYHWLIQNKDAVQALETTAMADMIFRSQEIKKQVVENDPKEKGERAHLNFGHTIGHAIEKSLNFSLLHGECVALGALAAMKMSAARGMIAEEEVLRFKKALETFHIAVSVSGLSKEETIKATKNDKKMDSGIIKFVLLKEIGCAYVDRTVTEEEMEKALDFIWG